MVIYQGHIQHSQNYHPAIFKQVPVYLSDLPGSSETPSCSGKVGRRAVEGRTSEPPLLIKKTPYVRFYFRLQMRVSEWDTKHFL